MLRAIIQSLTKPIAATPNRFISTGTISSLVRWRVPIVETQFYNHRVARMSYPYVFRGDKFSFSDLKNQNGFIAGNNNLSLLHHATKRQQFNSDGSIFFGPSGYVSTTFDLETATFFAKLLQKKYKIICAIQRPTILIAPYCDITKEFRSKGYNHPLNSEEDVPAVGAIPFNDIYSYKTSEKEQAFTDWTPNPDFVPREFSLMIRSAKDEEATFGKHLPYTYPSYHTAKIVASILEQRAQNYCPSQFMVCFEKLRIDEVEAVLERKAGSGFDDSDLPTYYEKKFDMVQKLMSRPRAKLSLNFSGTLFSPEKKNEACQATVSPECDGMSEPLRHVLPTP